MADLLERLQQALASPYRIERELGRGIAAVGRTGYLKHRRPLVIKPLDPDVAVATIVERSPREIEATRAGAKPSPGELPCVGPTTK